MNHNLHLLIDCIPVIWPSQICVCIFACLGQQICLPASRSQVLQPWFSFYKQMKRLKSDLLKCFKVVSHILSQDRHYWLWNNLCLSCFSQHPKVRNVFNLDFPDSNHLAKTLTIVSGPDTVNLTYHNFFASKEKVTQVRSHCLYVCLTFVTSLPSHCPNTAIDH